MIYSLHCAKLQSESGRTQVQVIRVSYVTGYWWEWRRWVNEGGDECFLDSLTFLLPPSLARMLHCTHKPGSDVHHCLSLGISFSWLDFGSWLFPSYGIAFLALTYLLLIFGYLFFPSRQTWIAPIFQWHSSHNSTVTHSVLWLGKPRL